MLTVAALAPSLDLTYVVGRLNLGQIHRPTDVVRCAGGKPLNMARAANTLGAEVELVAVLGGPTGHILGTMLEEAGIATVAVPTPAETRTCVSIAAEDTGTLTEVYEYVAPIPPDVWEQLTEAVATAVRDRPGWLSISGGPPRELAADAIAMLVAIGHSAGVRVAVDTHGPALPAAVEAGPELVKINRSEAAEVLGIESAGSLVAMARAVQERTGGTVVLTDGAAGSVGLDASGRVFEIPAPELRGRFPVGSGDAYLGGLLTALDRGDDLATALRLATAAGVANAQLPGPGNFDLALVRELASEK